MWRVLVMMWGLCAAEEAVERTTLKWKDGRYGLVGGSGGNLEIGTVLYSSFASTAPHLFSYEATSPETTSISLVSCTGTATLYIPPQQVDSRVTYEIGSTEVIAHFYKSPPGIVQFFVTSSEPGKYRLSVQSEGHRAADHIWVDRVDSGSVLVKWEPLEMADGSELLGSVSYQVLVSAELPNTCMTESIPVVSVSTTGQSAVLPVESLSAFVVSVLAEVQTPQGRVEVPYLQSEVRKEHWTSGEIEGSVGLAVLGAAVVGVWLWKAWKREKEGEFRRLE